MKLSKYRDETVVPPLSFISDLRCTVGSIRGASRACGVGKAFIGKVFRGEKVSRSRLEMAMDNFYKGVEDNDIRIQLRGMMGGSVSSRWAFLRLLRTMARVVEQFEDSMKLCPDMRKVYVFPPRDAICQLVESIEFAARTVRAIHKTCPEYDYLIFRDTPKLLQKMRKEDEVLEST